MKIAMIGCGNMATAILSGMLKSGVCAQEEICVTDCFEEARKKAETRFGVRALADNRAAAEGADLVIFAVKPQVLDGVLAEIRDVPGRGAAENCSGNGGVCRPLYLSIAAGKTLDYYAMRLGADAHVVRAMPNMPAQVGQGMTGFCASEAVTPEEKELASSVLNSFGNAEEVPEKLMAAVGAVSGCSPAYIFMLIEAMADAAVAEGMPRAQAYRFAAKAVEGSAKTVLDSGRLPADLKDAVCSPGGSTIEGVQVLEEGGFRGLVMAALRAAAGKDRKL